MIESLDDSYKEFWRDLLLDAVSSGDPQHSCFFRMFSELAAENGDCPDLVYTPARREGSRSYQIDGYSIDPDRGELYLAICDFRTEDDLGSLNQGRIDSLFGRAERFFLSAIKEEFINSLEETSAAFEAAYPIFLHRDDIKRVRILILSNARFASRNKGVETKEVGGYTYTHNILDFGRYVDVANSRTGSEPIEIDLSDLTDEPVLCIRSHTGGSRYASYLAAIPGELLAKVYGLYGARLLEQNVRTFLQARTKVNKGIIETIVSAPEMFFAYNNGVTATAAGIKTEALEDGSTAIRSIQNLQIVNGGQTTASILYAKDKSRADLKHVYVQMKLSVVPADQLEDVVPKISRYANTQNRISEADFFSGHPFHLAMERVSRSLSPPQKAGAFSASKWFYERARGQYKDKQAYLSVSQKNRFVTEYPKDQVITKTDLAKVELTFNSQPHIVSRGAQKCFLTFAETIGAAWENEPEQFDEDYFRQIVAKAIVFRWTDSMIGRSAWYKEDRGYKANILTYTIAWLVNALKSERSSELDLQQVWNDQELSGNLREVLSMIAPEVAKTVKSAPPDVKNISEYCKREVCWDAVQECNAVDRSFLEGLATVPLSAPESAGRTSIARGTNSSRVKTDELREQIADAEALEAFARNAGLLTDKSSAALRALREENAVLSVGERTSLRRLLTRAVREGYGDSDDGTDEIEGAMLLDAKEQHDWPEIVDRLNQGAVAEIRIEMGSPGSAQVTRWRLLKEWNGISARTKGPVLILSLKDNG